MDTQNHIISKDMKKLAGQLSVAGDATRLKILCFLFGNQEACVSEIAKAIEVSVPTTSYHLNKMADKNLLSRHKKGNSVCYRIMETDFMAKIEHIVCEK